MKIAGIWNVWSDSSDLLEKSVKLIEKSLDFIVIVYQTTSHRGEYDSTCIEHLAKVWGRKVHKIRYEPAKISAIENETRKRNLGINFAKSLGAEHYICLDCDEYYEPNEFDNAKAVYSANKAKASYCDLYTYFLEKDVRLFNKEPYYVPMFCNIKYPAGDYGFGGIIADPTRKVNVGNPMRLPITMHHLSYIRKDIWQKVNNHQILPEMKERVELLKDDLHFAIRNMYSKFYNDRLERVNSFFI